MYAIAGAAEAGNGEWPTYRGNVQRTGAVAGLPSGNMLPQISKASIVGTLVQGQPGSISVSCDAMDPDTGVLTVVADLSAVSGPISQLLTKGAGDQWSWSGTVTPVNYGMQIIPLTVTDTDGATASIASSIRVMALPQLSNVSITGVPVRKQGGTVTVSCTASDPDGTIQTVQVDLSAVGGSATQGLVKGTGNNWSWTGPVAPASLGTKIITFQAVDNEANSTSATTDIVVVNAAPVISAPVATGLLVKGQPGNVTISCNASDPDGSVSSVTVNLAALGGLVAQPLTPGAGNAWSWSGSLTPASDGSIPVVFTATDNEAATAQATASLAVLPVPVVSNPEVTSKATIAANASATITASCQATYPSDSVQSVSVDLSSLGGPSSQPLTHVVGDTWSWTGLVNPTGVGDMVVTFTATGANLRVGTGQTTVKIVQYAPMVSDIQVSGILQVGKSGTISLSCLATAGGTATITGVIGDLSPIGGTSLASFTFSGGRWYWTGAVLPTTMGNRTITVTAYDDGGLSGWAKSDIPVNPSTKWAPLSLGGALESSPAIATDGTVYLGSGDNNLYAVNPTGTVKWTRSLNGNVQSSPAIGPDGTIYVGSSDMKLHAVNPDGSVKWTALSAGQTGARVFSSPAVSADGSVVYVGSDDKNVYAFNAATGASAWAGPFVTAGKVASSPAIATDGTIYVGSLDKSLYAINPNGTKKWSCPTAGLISTSPAIAADGTIYIASSGSTLYAVNPTTGAVTWSFALGGSFVYSCPVIGSDGTIYIGAESDGGKIYAINPNGTKKWECLLDGLVRSTPLIGSDGVIYVGTNGQTAYAINPDGTVKWTFKTGGVIRASMALASDGTLYVASYDDWSLYAINASGSLANSAWPMFHGGLEHTGLAN